MQLQLQMQLQSHVPVLLKQCVSLLHCLFISFLALLLVFVHKEFVLRFRDTVQHGSGVVLVDFVVVVDADFVVVVAVVFIIYSSFVGGDSVHFYFQD